MDIELLSVHTKSRPDSACMNGKSHMATDKNSALLSRDAADLARVGKKDVLKVCRADFGDDYLFFKFAHISTQRRFSLTSTIGFTCSLMLTWEAIMM